jgi:hypothetical protein
MHINLNPFLCPRNAQSLSYGHHVSSCSSFLVVFPCHSEALQDQSRFCPTNFGLYAQSPTSEGCKLKVAIRLGRSFDFQNQRQST